MEAAGVGLEDLQSLRDSLRDSLRLADLGLDV